MSYSVSLVVVVVLVGDVLAWRWVAQSGINDAPYYVVQDVLQSGRTYAEKHLGKPSSRTIFLVLGCRSEC